MIYSRRLTQVYPIFDLLLTSGWVSKTFDILRKKKSNFIKQTRNCFSNQIFVFVFVVFNMYILVIICFSYGRLQALTSIIRHTVMSCDPMLDVWFCFVSFSQNHHQMWYRHHRALGCRIGHSGPLENNHDGKLLLWRSLEQMCQTNFKLIWLCNVFLCDLSFL